MFSIALGGALGSISRFGISSLLNQNHPWGTLSANVMGSLILGGLFATTKQGMLSSESPFFAFLAIGFCGAFTTFSTFSLEVFQILGDGKWLSAFVHIIANFTLSFGAIYAGYFFLMSFFK